MDQLFLMQRYWGSDEESSKEENNFKINSQNHSFNSHTPVQKQKSYISLIDADNDDSIVSNKKRTLDSYLEINNKINKNSGQKTNSSNDNDIEILSDIDSAKNINSTLFLSGTDESTPTPKSIKKHKSKDAKLSKRSKTVISEDSDIFDTTANSDYSTEYTERNIYDQSEIIGVSNINSKKEKKQRHRYFDVVDNDAESISLQSVQLNKRISNTISENNATESASQETVEVKSRNKKSKLKKEKEIVCDSDEIAGKQDLDIKINKRKEETPRYFNYSELNDNSKTEKIKKSKRKLKEIDDESDVGTKSENINSQAIENVGEAFPTIGQTYQQKVEVVKHTLPEWLRNPTYISVNLQEKEIPISELNYLDLETKNNLRNAGISFLFPVQLAVIPWLMQSKEQSLLIRPSDICVSAPTGSGKTLAFVLPIVQSLKDRIVCAIRALVVLPVSELAIQVYKVFQTYIEGTDLKVALLTGKKSFVDEQNSLVKSTGHSVQSLVDIIVATPGRVHDHIYRTRGFCLKRLRYLVIDEADRMMEEIQQGWLKQVENAVFHDCISPNCVCSSYNRTFTEPTSAYNFGFISQPLQKLLYSATLTHNPEQLHTLSLYKPKLFTASSACLDKDNKGSCAIPPGIKMFQVICEGRVKPMVICHLIKHHKFKRVLCFTETVERAHRLHLVLEEMKLLKVREISSFNKPTQRKIVLNQFRSGKVNVLVCSDLVARGIDIQDIDCVISYDVPENDKIYIHRVGRTARAGKTGIAMTLLSEGEIPHFQKMLSTNSEIKLPEKIFINSQDLKPFVQSFQAALKATDAKLKNEKSQVPGKSFKKARKRLK